MERRRKNGIEMVLRTERAVEQYISIGYESSSVLGVDVMSVGEL
jgi:hypothetical protein